jgi:hypothetical protein
MHKFKVHEFILYPIDFFRLAIKKFKLRTDYKGGIITLNFECYEKRIVKLFADLLYDVNESRIDLEQILELILFIYDCDNYDESEFPWHFEAINHLCDKIQSQIQYMAIQEKSLVVAKLYKIIIDPVTVMLEKLFGPSLNKESFPVQNLEKIIFTSAGKVGRVGPSKEELLRVGIRLGRSSDLYNAERVV